MSKLSKLAATALVTLAGAGSLLFAATSVAALPQNGSADSGVTVLADSPWDSPVPKPKP